MPTYGMPDAGDLAAPRRTLKGVLYFRNEAVTDVRAQPGGDDNSLQPAVLITLVAATRKSHVKMADEAVLDVLALPVAITPDDHDIDAHTVPPVANTMTGATPDAPVSRWAVKFVVYWTSTTASSFVGNVMPSSTT